MKILLVDDGDAKYSRMLTFISKNNDFKQVTITKASSGIEARRSLKTTQYDMLILDILLPWRPEGEPNINGSREVINAIMDGEDILPPLKIVGLTGSTDASNEVDDFYRSNTWTVLKFNELSDSWLDALGESIKYMIARSSTPLQYDADLLVVTALREPEMAAVHRLPWMWSAEEPLDDVTFIRRGRFSSHARDYQVVTAVADRMGMVSTSVLTTKAIALLRPRFVVMVGICAGYYNETKIGDVILGDPVWDYQSGKRTRDPDGISHFKIDPHPLRTSPLIASRMKQVGLDQLTLNQIRTSREDDPGHDLRVLVGPMVTGSAVIADPEIAKQIKDTQGRKILGLEMEAYGLYCAVEHSGKPKPIGFSLKAVCDFADEKKDDSAQKYAAYTSAAVMRHFFEKYMKELSSNSE